MFETSDSRSSLSGSTQFVSSFCWRVLKSWYSSLSGIVGKMFCHSFHSTKQVWEFYFDNLVFTVFAFRQMCHSTIDTESCCRVRSQGSTVSKFIDKYLLIILCPVHIISFSFSLKNRLNLCSKLIHSASNFLGQFPWSVFHCSCYSEWKLIRKKYLYKKTGNSIWMLDDCIVNQKSLFRVGRINNIVQIVVPIRFVVLNKSSLKAFEQLVQSDYGDCARWITFRGSRKLVVKTKLSTDSTYLVNQLIVLFSNDGRWWHQAEVLVATGTLLKGYELVF